jgi:hypothetical protein
LPTRNELTFNRNARYESRFAPWSIEVNSGKPAIVHVKIDPEAITPTTTLSALREKAMAARGG